MKVLLGLTIFASLGVACYAVCGDSTFGGCDKSRGLCWDADNSPNPATTFCTCKAGYKFQNPTTQKGTCVDIDECTSGAHNCDTVHGRCVNTIGSHYCSCNYGYVLDFTKTQCLVSSKITGKCNSGGYYRKKRSADFDDEGRDMEDIDVQEKLLNLFLSRDSDGVKASTCTCDTGYTKCGDVCADINECSLKKSKCDLVNGYCHNSIGGYFCSCKSGYILGPCGLKCYKPSLRPAACTNTELMVSTLVRSDSNGYNDEASLALVLDAETERASASGLLPAVYKTRDGTACTGHGTTTTDSFDVNHDGKADVIIHYTCIGGKWVVKSTFDKEAFWTQWTCWTECKATCHGGIQTRTRYCKNGLVGEGNCAGAASESKTCYTGTKCPTRVRRNAKTLTSAQKCDLLQAFAKYKADSSTNGFWAAAGTHVFPKQCNAATGGPGGCCYHGARLNFVAWHRAELLNFEEGLTRYMEDKTLGLPYWDWLVDDAAPELVWSKTINGHANPFASMVIRHDLTPPGELVRATVPMPMLVQLSRNSYLDTATKLMQAHNIHEYSEALENAHNTIHAAVCYEFPACVLSMGNLEYAAYDPIFFFHHTNVDRLFSYFQQVLHTNGETAWTRQSALEPQESIYHFNEVYNPFRNTTLTAFKRLNALSTIDDVYYYKEMLGYSYDTLAVPTSGTTSGTGGGTTTWGDSEKEHIPNILDALNIMQYEQSVGMNVRIGVYVHGEFEGRPALPACTAVSEDNARFVGAFLILGTASERPWQSARPALKDMAAWLAKNATTRLASINYKLTACYSTDVTCVKNCPQAPSSVSNKLPTPQLMFYPKNIRDDVLKFEWDTRIRLPTWTINVKSATEWLYFWGTLGSNVYMVPSTSYASCSTTGGIKVDCSSSCVLSTGHHYFISGDYNACKAGLKMDVLAAL